MKQPVIHCTEGRNAWKLGFTGFTIRLRGFAIPIIIAIASAGVPWWWPEILPAEVIIDLKWASFFFIVFISCISILALRYLRYRIKRSLDTKYYLHRLTHNIRDKQTQLYEKLELSKNFSNNQLDVELEMLLTQICDNAAMYFRLLTNDHSICAAIRLVSKPPDYVTKNNNLVYKTYARSMGLNIQRAKTSEPVPINIGIARFLREEKNAEGILIYYDLKLAADLGAYYLTKNDKSYPDEIKSMMVAPLNAWSLKKQEMIGILYISSREEKKFSTKYFDSLAFIADLTATTIASSIEFVKLKCYTVNNGGG